MSVSFPFSISAHSFFNHSSFASLHFFLIYRCNCLYSSLFLCGIACLLHIILSISSVIHLFFDCFVFFGGVARIFCGGVLFTSKRNYIAYMSTQREVEEGQTGSHRAKRANFGRGVRGSFPGKFEKPILQMVQSTLFLSIICEYN